jgi:DNA-binding NtrC family response regulator
MARILVVDDEIGIRELLSEILYDEGHTVELAENAAQARAARLRMRPDLVLLDIWMPEIDGVSLLKEWGSQGLLDMPVIMMSGHATIDTAVEATRLGAMNFLEKPITMQCLLKAVAAGLASGRSPRASTAYSTVPAALEIFQGETDAPSAQALLAEEAPLVNSQLGSISLDQPLREARDAFERIYFEYHLIRESHSMTRVSERTGLERTHLYRKLKQLGIESARKRGS